MLAKRHGEHKKVDKKEHIYSSNRNKIQANLVKQLLVNRNLRVQWGNDYPSTKLVISHVIVWVRVVWVWSAPLTLRWRVFMEEGESIM